MKQTATPYALINLPEKEALVEHYVGKSVDDLRTPALIIDRSVFARNCAKMHEKALSWGTGFRAHLKTHKTAEGTRLQLQSEAGKTNAVVVSTLMEAWQVVKAGLFKDGVVKDLLYGLPIGLNKIEDLSNLWDEVAPSGGIVRVLIDHPDQVKFLEQFEKGRLHPRQWSVFVKVDGGQKRAGVPTASSSFEPLIKALFSSSAISVFGFYCHAGNAYASTSLPQASTFLSEEVDAVNTAAGLALEILSKSNIDAPSESFVLSVGSTPTAHAASAETRAMLSSLLHGTLELHAGNYPMLDLQQEHTSLIQSANISQRVRTTVVSYYPGRGANGTDEAVVDGGAIAFSKDTGPSGGFGRVIGTGWQVGRMSQEHGILTRTEPVNGDKLEVGDIVEIVGQHACLIAAAYPWYYIVDSTTGDEKKVVDVWVPWKGW
ncbi:alanine racemase [Moniliophthora roreri MCA 2997]|uniref:D-serine dehydratase n=2 Tax=Moniliophthora roreri TaxID=221103 RepID=V2XFG1_MONRO|nr:alanine racemase [Moniliophthora roreri MCA 2997]KAI3621862.1 alanine racemase [Moniliophthora roreri]